MVFATAISFRRGAVEAEIVEELSYDHSSARRAASMNSARRSAPACSKLKPALSALLVIAPFLVKALALFGVAQPQVDDIDRRWRRACGAAAARASGEGGMDISRRSKTAVLRRSATCRRRWPAWASASRYGAASAPIWPPRSIEPERQRLHHHQATTDHLIGQREQLRLERDARPAGACEGVASCS